MQINHIAIALLTLCLFCFVTQIHAVENATILVDAVYGIDAPACGTNASPCATIAYASENRLPVPAGGSVVLSGAQVHVINDSTSVSVIGLRSYVLQCAGYSNSTPRCDVRCSPHNASMSFVPSFLHFNHTDTVKVERISFSNCYSHNNGGGAALRVEAGLSVVLNDVRFVNCTSTSDDTHSMTLSGGAMHLNVTGDVLMQNISVHACSAIAHGGDVRGGAAFVRAATVSLRNTSFSSCTAARAACLQAGVPCNAFGGALFVDASSVNTHGLYASYCAALGGGTPASLEPQTQPSGTGDGGFAVFNALNVTLFDTHLSQCNATGGASYMVGGASGHGGAFVHLTAASASDYSMLSMQNCSVINCSAIGGMGDVVLGSGEGGGVLVRAVTRVHLSHCLFQDNMAASGVSALGGAILMVHSDEAASIEPVALSMEHVRFEGNVLRALICDRGRSCYYKQEGTGLGAAIFAKYRLYHPVEVRVSNASFVRNRIPCVSYTRDSLCHGFTKIAGGAAVYMYYDTFGSGGVGMFNCMGCYFDSNVVHGGQQGVGGAIGLVTIDPSYPWSWSLNLGRSAITNNAVYTDVSYVNGDIVVGYVQGGGIYVSGTTELSQSTVQSNVLFVNDTGSNIVARTSAFLQGGGVYTKVLNCVNSSVKANVVYSQMADGVRGAPAGGGAYSIHASQLLRNCTFVQNIAASFRPDVNGSGGGAWMGEWPVVMDGVHFRANHAANGAGLCLGLAPVASQLNVSALLFRSNNALFVGGGIHVNYAAQWADWKAFIDAMSKNPQITFDNNSATSNDNVGGSMHSLNLTTPSRGARWPGQLFNTSLLAFDSFGNRRLSMEPLNILKLSTNVTARFMSGTGSNIVLPSRAYVGFSMNASSVRGAAGDVLHVALRLSATRSYTAFMSIHVTECPPPLYLDLSSNECRTCDGGFFALGGVSCTADNRSLCCGHSCAAAHGSEESENCVWMPTIQSEPVIIIAGGFAPSTWLSTPGNLNVMRCRERSCKELENTQCQLRVGNRTSIAWTVECVANSTCHQGYKLRLCDACACGDGDGDSSTCYFRSYAEAPCTKCTHRDSFKWYAAIALGVIALLLGILMWRRARALVIFAELGVSVLAAAILPVEWHVMVEIIIVAVLYVLLRTRFHHVSGVVKVFVFYAQTSAAIFVQPSAQRFIHAVVTGLERFNSALNIHFSGLECIFPHIFGDLATHGVRNRFLAHVLAPLLLAASIVLGTCLIYVPSIYRSYQCCKKLQRRDASEESDASLREDSNEECIAEFGAEEGASLLSSALSINLDADGSSTSNMLPSSADVYRTIFLASSRFLLFFLYLVYFELTSTVLQMLRPCENGYAPAHRWLSCFDHEIQTIQRIAWSAFGLYVVGIPLLFGGLIYKYAENGDDQDGGGSDDIMHAGGAARAVHFLHESYNPGYRFFELLLILRRVLISLVFVFASNSAQTPLFVGILVLWSGALIYSTTFPAAQRPFRHEHDQWLDISSSIVLIFTYSTVVAPGEDLSLIAVLVCNILFMLVLVDFMLERRPSRLFLGRVRACQFSSARK